jgi:hypothetical protein
LLVLLRLSLGPLALNWLLVLRHTGLRSIDRLSILLRSWVLWILLLPGYTLSGVLLGWWSLLTLSLTLPVSKLLGLWSWIRLHARSRVVLRLSSRVNGHSWAAHGLYNLCCRIGLRSELRLCVSHRFWRKGINNHAGLSDTLHLMPECGWSLARGRPNRL